MKNIKKITSILMVASITMVLFSACGSKTTAITSTAADTSSATASTTSTASNVDTTSTATDTKKNDPTEMKTLYTTVLKALVTDKTITQTQSDKVLEVVSKKPTDGAKPTGTAPKDGTKAPADGTKPNATAPKDGVKPKNDRLAELVTNKVITQAQADTINTKVQEAMKSAQTN